MDFPVDQIPSHYEFVVESKNITKQIQTKQQALYEMNFLEGWCSKSKAAILIDLIFMFKPEKVVEIGVFGGKSLLPMAFALRENGFGKIYGIDPWTTEDSIKGMEGEHRNWWQNVNHSQIFEDLMNKIIRLKLTQQIEIIKKNSEEAPLIRDIDILHIDGNHSEESSYFDVNKWVPLVSKGGVIIFDDIDWGQTKRAVEYLDEHCFQLKLFKGQNIWGVWIKE